MASPKPHLGAGRSVKGTATAIASHAVPQKHVAAKPSITPYLAVLAALLVLLGARQFRRCREELSAPEFPGVSLAVLAALEVFSPPHFLEIYRLLALGVIVAVAVWFWVASSKARRKAEERANETQDLLRGQQDLLREQNAKIDTLCASVIKDADKEPPGIPREAMELSAELFSFAKDMAPFDPAYGLVTSMFSGPDESEKKVLRDFDAASRHLQGVRFNESLGKLFSKKFGVRVAQIIAGFRQSGLARQMTNGIDREPSSLRDLQVLAEQIYGLAKTLRDCTPRPGYAPEK